MGLLEKYEILEKIGEGGFSVVYRARHKNLKKIVAIKVPKENAKPNFKREGRIYSTLDHPGIVKAIDLDSESDPPYLVEEYIEGKSLEDIIKSSKKPISLRRSVLIMEQLADILSYIHSKGIIHRDIKPANIIVQEYDDIKLADLGIGKVISELIHEIYRTLSFQEVEESKIVVGTWDYIAPEIKKGKEVTSKADIYSYGMVFYELLTLKKPDIPYRPPSLLNKRVPLTLDELIEKCLKSDPEERPSAQEIYNILHIQPKHPKFSFKKLTLTGISVIASISLLLNIYLHSQISELEKKVSTIKQAPITLSESPKISDPLSKLTKLSFDNQKTISKVNEDYKNIKTSLELFKKDLEDLQSSLNKNSKLIKEQKNDYQNLILKMQNFEYLNEKLTKIIKENQQIIQNIKQYQNLTYDHKKTIADIQTEFQTVKNMFENIKNQLADKKYVSNLVNKKTQKINKDIEILIAAQTKLNKSLSNIKENSISLKTIGKLSLLFNNYTVDIKNYPSIDNYYEFAKVQINKLQNLNFEEKDLDFFIKNTLPHFEQREYFKYNGYLLSALIDKLSKTDSEMHFNLCSTSSELYYLCSYLKNTKIEVVGSADEGFGSYCDNVQLILNGSCSTYLASNTKNSLIEVYGNAGHAIGNKIENTTIVLYGGCKSIGNIKKGIIKVKKEYDDPSLYTNDRDDVIRKEEKDWVIYTYGGK